LRRQPLRVRRAELERLSAAFRPPIQLTPSTTSEAEARRMLEGYTAAQVGVEGLVVKALGDSYRPGHRGWLKLRIRSTAEAIVGAVLGSLEEPRQLVLGLPGDHGTLSVAGRTGPLRRRSCALRAARTRGRRSCQSGGSGGSDEARR